MTRKEKAAETKRKLYETAEELFTRHGVDGVSVDAIVAAAGLSKGAFYVHFTSKDALIAALIEGRAQHVDAEYQAFIDALPEETPAADMLLGLTRRVFGLIEDGIGYEKIRALYKAQLASGCAARAASGYNRAVYKMYCDVLARGIAAGEFGATLPAEEMARHCVLAMRGLVYEWCLRYPDFDLQQQAGAHFEMLLAGIRSQ